MLQLLGGEQALARKAGEGKLQTLPAPAVARQMRLRGRRERLNFGQIKGNAHQKWGYRSEKENPKLRRYKESPGEG